VQISCGNLGRNSARKTQKQHQSKLLSLERHPIELDFFLPDIPLAIPMVIPELDLVSQI